MCKKVLEDLRVLRAVGHTDKHRVVYDVILSEKYAVLLNNVKDSVTISLPNLNAFLFLDEIKVF